MQPPEDQPADLPPDQVQPSDDSAANPVTSFRFSAQSVEDIIGQQAVPISGAIDATDPSVAQERLEALQLRVLSLEPVATSGKAKPIRGGDFLAFNQQLAYMTEAGLPMEQGLRLIANDAKNGPLRKTIDRVADELQAGKPLHEAFAAHRGAFPALYSTVLEAGVRTGNLPAVLMGLGRHLEMLQRLKSAVWRSIAYPLVVFLGVMGMLGILGAVLAPQFKELFTEFDTALPAITTWVLAIAEAMPYLVGAGLALAAMVFGSVLLLRAKGKEQAVVDALLWVPLLGQAIRRNMLSRWCDALKLGLHAGLDLPRALRVAADTISSSRLEADTQRMTQVLEQGRAIRGNTKLRFVPEAVPAAIELASHANDLPGMLEHLAELYQQQAEARVSALHALLGPAMLIVVAVIISVVIGALFLPMLQLMDDMMFFI